MRSMKSSEEILQQCLEVSLTNMSDFLGSETHVATGKVTCGLCKKRYPKPKRIGHGVQIASFGALTIAQCCFPKVEQAIFAERDNILAWFEQCEVVDSLARLKTSFFGTK